MTETTTKCTRCDGCGQLADSDAREPWTTWTSLPLQSSAAVLLGMVKPIPCDVCEGTGQEVVFEAAPYTGEEIELICDALTGLWNHPARRDEIKSLIERHPELSLAGEHDVESEATASSTRPCSGRP